MPTQQLSEEEDERRIMKYNSKASSGALVLLALLSWIQMGVAKNDTLFAYGNTYGSGWCTTGSKNDDSVEWSNSASGVVSRGWTYFYVGSLPQPPKQYSSVELHFAVVMVQNLPALYINYIPYAYPLTQLGPALFDTLHSDSMYQLASYSSVDTNPSGGPEPYIVTLPAWSNWLNNYPVSQNFWTFSWLSNENGGSPEFGEADGWNPPSKRRSFITEPFLVFIP
jgi:hypothetical protein